ncbi:ankyrin-like protein [Variola virus]|uniref:Ankyrin-like protein n=1 Tax=Variola virus TaxID=10255 RepID=Q89074_VARV|nr:B14R [Variola virus]ABF23380.1 ankyrin-like protein [Variola virus]ABF28996.1 ankyrin-like protein [Variola virus]CAB54607.1 B13R protein [Variola minor virus]
MFVSCFNINGTNFILALCIIFVPTIKLYIQIIMRCVYTNCIDTAHHLVITVIQKFLKYILTKEVVSSLGFGKLLSTVYGTKSS